MHRHNFGLLVLLLSFCFTGNAQHSKNQHNNIVIGIKDSLYSNILNEEREIWIHTPENFDSAKYYPVVYLLDAEEHFYVVAGMMKQLVPWQVPESIIVGITNIDRIRDFTPTNVSFSRGHNTITSGGAINFLNFLNDELKPYINSKFPTENNFTIIGHSTAGLFVLHTYLNSTESFDNYLAIEPSLWWDKENLVKSSQNILEKRNRTNASLYLAVANSLGEKLDTAKVRKDKSEPTEQIRANLKFHDILTANQNQLDFSWEYFDNEDHGSVTVPAFYNGLRSVFNWFPFPEMWRFNNPKKYSTKELTSPFYKHYEKLSKKMKRQVRPAWALINDISSFMLIGHNLPKKALAYLEMNAHFYPENSKTYLALGNFYQTRKDIKKATANYKRAVEIDGNKEAKIKLKELEK